MEQGKPIYGILKMKERKLEERNFSLGMRRDGSLHLEMERGKYNSPVVLQSLRTISNYDIDYEEGLLRTRLGYERYTTNELPGIPTQLYYHTDLARTEEIILTICNDKWYRAIPDGDHELIIDETATSPDGGFRKPALSWENRVIFATDKGVYWTDKDRIGEDTKYYQLGISKPEVTMQIEPKQAAGFPSPANSGARRLDNSSHRKYGFRIVFDEETTLNTISLYMQRMGNLKLPGNVRIRMETNDPVLLDRPSGTLYDDYSISEWKPATRINGDSPTSDAADYTPFLLKKAITFPTGTYWVVLEGDDSYYNNYINQQDAFGFQVFYVVVYTVVVADNPINYNVMQYDWDSRSWVNRPHEMGVFHFGGLYSSRIYEYIFTFYNSIYGIESRPSDPARFQVTQRQAALKITLPDSDDDQVDKVRIYRRILGVDDEMTTPFDDIIEPFRYVAEGDINSQWIDGISDEDLGAELQTFDHYRLDEGDDTNSGLREAIVPIGFTIWKGRIWAWKKDSNILYFSKRLEIDGATGLTGNMIPDYFPLENQLEIAYPSAILGASSLSGDQLAIYFRNGSIFVLWGMDDPMNPPTDYLLREMVTTIGLVASGGLAEFGGKHTYLSRQGLYVFHGTQDPEYLSEFMQSIFNSVSDEYIDDSRIITFGSEIWILIDSNNDGEKDSILILDTQKSTPTWKIYDYDINISDFMVKELGSDQGNIYAADATNKHIIKLQSTYTDNGKAITSYLETHKTKIGDTRFSFLEILARYTGNAGSYDVTIYDHNNDEYNINISPDSSDDIRGHRSRVRASSKGTFKIKIQQTSVEQTDLLGYSIEYIEH